MNAARALERRVSSVARSVGAKTVGAPVVTPTTSGGATAWFVNEHGDLVMHGGEGAELLTTFGVGAVPVGGLAAAYLGPEIGTAFFFAARDARIAAVDVQGRPLDGWPVSATRSNRSRLVSPALGDLDGDSVPEVVWPGDDGNVWAWSVDGSRLPGFPRAIGGVQDNAFIALADLDATPGVEIVVATPAGVLTALRADGTSLDGWPQATGATPAGLGVARTDAGPMVVVAGGSEVQGWSADGSRAWSRTIGYPALNELALGDLDADGYDEIVVPTVERIEVLDGSGALWGRPLWPRDLDGLPVTPAIIGALDPAGGVAVMLGVAAEPSGVHLVAYTTQAIEIPRWPLPGRAGQRVFLDDSDQDGATEVWAGSGPDSMLFVYDAGAMTYVPAAQQWPTAGANAARTYSRTYAPPAPVLDDVAPLAMNDVEITRVGVDVDVSWSVPGDDGPEGHPVRYDIRAGPVPFDEASFDVQPFAWSFDSSAPISTPLTLRLEQVDPTQAKVLAMVAVDRAGNRSALSNTVTLGELPSGITQLRPAVTPSRGVVTFEWALGAGSAPGEGRIEIYDGAGRKRRELGLSGGAFGTTRWDGRDEAGQLVRPGLYFARLRAGATEVRTRVVFLR